MPYYQPHDSNDFRQRLDSLDETSYDAFQSGPQPGFHGQPYSGPLPGQSYVPYEFQEPIQEPSSDKKGFIWIWIVVGLVMLLGAGFACLKLTGVIDSLFHSRPMTVEAVKASNLPSVEYSSLDTSQNASSVESGVPESNSESTSELVDQPVSAVQSPVEVKGGISFPTSRDGYPMPYYRAHMDDRQRAAYDAIYTGIVNMETTVMIPEHVKATDAEYIVDSVRADHPELFWVDDTYRYYSFADELVSLDLTYPITREQRDELEPRIDAEATRIATEAASLPSDYEKVKYYYTVLADTITYDYTRSNMTTQTIEGAFIEHVTACAGYSRALQYLCYKSNIPCIYVLGTSIGGENVPEGPHAWNVMNIDGVSVYTDVTWGDLDQPDLPYSYAFLGLTTLDLASLGHTWKYPNVMPACDDARYEQWTVDGTVLPGYDLDGTSNFIIDKFAQGYTTLYLRFPDAASTSAFWNDFTSEDSIGGQTLMMKAPWITAGDHYSHYVYKLDELNVIVYSRA